MKLLTVLLFLGICSLAALAQAECVPADLYYSRAQATRYCDASAVNRLLLTHGIIAELDISGCVADFVVQKGILQEISYAGIWEQVPTAPSLSDGKMRDCRLEEVLIIK
jgi:hypothetical protein